MMMMMMVIVSIVDVKLYTFMVSGVALTGELSLTCSGPAVDG